MSGIIFKQQVDAIDLEWRTGMSYLDLAIRLEEVGKTVLGASGMIYLSTEYQLAWETYDRLRKSLVIYELDSDVPRLPRR
ncbi:MAG: hypothetical protein V1735_04725 [Nanoarchaeota archaeon]